MAAVDKKTPPQAPSFASTEDESLKLSTDCVYFLASPLTCKKGSECEYRHSEAARTNPTDCRYWLIGQCSYNVGCSYRHPPLDGLVPPQAGNYAGPSHPVLSSGPPYFATPHNAAKTATPCYYFQMGSCMKGGRCTYLHGSIPPPYSKIKPVPATISATEANAFKKTFGGPEKNQQAKMKFHSNASKEIETPCQPQGNAAPKVVEAAKHYPHLAVAAPPAGNESWRSRAEHSHRASSVDDQNYQNGRDADDSLRESSPGFDVLVDDKLSEDEYYHNEDQYVRMRNHEGRRSSELDMGRHDDYNSVTDVDHDVYRSKRGYDAYDDLQDQYARKQRGASFERLSAHDMRVPYKPESPDFIQNSSDLRHRLSKQHRGNNGLRSVVNCDHKPNYHREDREHQNSRRDTRSPMRESSIGSRLQGRIKLPRRSSPVRGGNLYSERDSHGERYLGRSSSHQGRLRDRLGGRVPAESSEGRSFRGQMRKDANFQANGDVFAGPKRLSELRGTERTDNKHQQLTGQQSVSGDISFDGPKPLSEILKRKRTAAGTASVGDVNLSSSANNSGALSSSPEQTKGTVHKNIQALIDEGVEEETGNSNKKVKLIKDESSLPDDEKHPEFEDGLYGGDAEVDEEVNQGDREAPQIDQEFDQGDGEYDYEEDNDVEGYNLNERDVAGNEGGFMDEDEGDDFAKKLGVSL